MNSYDDAMTSPPKQKYVGTHRKAKAQARADTIETAIPRWQKDTGTERFTLVSLCSLQEDHPDAELQRHLARGYITESDFYGVDNIPDNIRANAALYPEARWTCQDLAIVKYDGPTAVYADFTDLIEQFYRGTGTLSLTKAYDHYTEKGLADHMRRHPGRIQRVMTNLSVGDLLVVNVCTDGRGTYFTGATRHLFLPALLRNNPGWKLRPYMSGSTRNFLMRPKAGPKARFYVYQSGVFHFTSFALVKVAEQDAPHRTPGERKPKNATAPTESQELADRMLDRGEDDATILAATGLSTMQLAGRKARRTRMGL